MYCIDGQPYSRLPVFKIAPVAGGGKVEIVHENLLLPFGGNIKGGPVDKGNQQDVNEPQDSIITVSSDGETEAEGVSTDPKPVGEGDSIYVQHTQTEESQIIGLKLYGDGQNSI